MQSAKKRRARSINSRLRRIVLVPTAALVVLWLVLSGYLFSVAGTQKLQGNAMEETLAPAAAGFADVMDERTAAISYVARSEENEKELRQQFEKTQEASDESMGRVIDSLAEFSNYAPGATEELIRELGEQFEGISDIRARVEARTASRTEVLDYYNTLMQTAADIFEEQARSNSGTEVSGAALSTSYIFRTVDLLSQTDAQLARAFTSGELSAEEQAEFTRLMGSYQILITRAGKNLGPEESERMAALLESEKYAALLEAQEQISDREAPHQLDEVTGEVVPDLSVPVSQEEWHHSHHPVCDELIEIGTSQAAYTNTVQQSEANRSLLIAILGSVGIGALSAFIFVLAHRSAITLVARLNRLRDDAQELTDRHLPSIMERLRHQEPVDVDTEIPDIVSRQDEDEIGQVARSFDSAQRAAIDAMVRQAELRQGVNRVFLNIAHRSQTLIHRQLRLLDRMERAQEDPEQLTELFKLDHLATRSRRNAENLLILGGETPGRTWNRPMPLIDVLRGAISESGDYTRVERQHVARVALKGPAVADVIHLVAELVDNATTFSPPHSKVRLSGEQVPNGVTIDIEDRGLGMSEEELTAANEVLANPPEFDVMRLNDKMRLGLFVVSRLARRHGIKVSLRTSPYGGVQAIVLLPMNIIADRATLPPAPEAGSDQPAAEAAEKPVPAAESAAEAKGGTGSASGEDSASGGADLLGGSTNEDGSGSGEGRGISAETFGHTPGTGDMLAGSSASPPTSAAEDPQTLPRRMPIRSDSVHASTDSGLPRRSGPRSNGSGPAGGNGTGLHGSNSNGADGNHAVERKADGTVAESAGGNGVGTTAPGAMHTDAPPAAESSPAQSGAQRPALPRRIPQANLAPQLYDEPPAPTSASAPAAEEEDRSERLRHTMAAFQQGTRRGRVEGQQRWNDTEKDS